MSRLFERHRLAAALFAVYAVWLLVTEWPLVREPDGEAVWSDTIPALIASLVLAILLALGFRIARWLALAVAVVTLGVFHVLIPLTLFSVADCHRAAAAVSAAQCYVSFSVPTLAAAAVLALCWKPFRRSAP
jgi:uncharacterized membrane protein YvlD (DUF360 family)